MSPAREHLAAALLLALFLALAWSSAARKSATVDEFAHVPAGLYAWTTRDFSLYAKTPPLGRLIVTLPALLMRPSLALDLGRFPSGSWQPWEYGADFLARNREDYGRLLLAARAMVIVAGALLCFLVWRTARAWYGPAGGLVSLLAAALSPTLLAHSGLATTDVLAALASLVFFLALLAYLERPGLGRAVLLGAAVGLAVLIKFTLLFWAPVALLAPGAAHFWPRGPAAAPARARALAGQAAGLMVMAWLVLAAGYGGQGVAFHSELKPASRTISRLMPVLARVPLPRDFIAGLDGQLRDAEGGEWTQGNYLFGEWYGGNRWYYYLAALMVKEPLVYLVGAGLVIFMLLARRSFDPRELTLLLLAGGYFIFASGFGSLQLGLRYLLPIYPVGFLLLGRLGPAAFPSGTQAPERARVRVEAEPSAKFRRATRTFLALAGVWLVLDQVMIWPDYLAYFNPLARGPENGWRVLLDSNLDWGQDLPGLRDWMVKHQVDRLDLAYFGHDDPGRFQIAYDLPGRGSGNRFLAVSVTLLAGKRYPMTFVPGGVAKSDPLWDELVKYRDREPVARIGYTIFIYDRTPGMRNQR